MGIWMKHEHLMVRGRYKHSTFRESFKYSKQVISLVMYVNKDEKWEEEEEEEEEEDQAKKR